eukprot:m51a1_g2185 putative wd repeat domain 43 (663) ;mRNA; r:111005-113640
MGATRWSDRRSRLAFPPQHRGRPARSTLHNPSEMAVACQFDSALERFALVTSDTRLRVFDVKQRRLVHECRERDHLSFQYTCMAWGCSAQHASGKKTKKARRAGQTLIALGTSRGDVTVWDVQTGEAVRKLGEEGAGHRGDVRAVRFSASGARLVSAGADGHVIVWNTTSGEVVAKFKAERTEVTALEVAGADADTIYTAQLTIREWDGAEKTPKATRRLAASHASPVAEMAAAGQLLVSRSAGERYLYVWAPERDANAVVGLAAGAQPISIDARVADTSDEARESLAVACATAAGGVDVWEVDTGAKARKAPAAPQCVVAAPAGSSPATHVLAARFDGAATLLVARGPVVLPRFDRVLTAEHHQTIRSEDGTLLGKLALPEVDESSAAEHQAEEEEGKTPKSRKRSANDVDRLDVLEREAVPGTPAENTDAALAAIPAPAAPRGKGAKGTELAEMVLQDRVDASKDRKALKADSLHSALVQAVKTNDRTLLESCLAIRDRTVIENTVRRMPYEAVVPFLTLLVGKFQTNPGKAIACVVWIKAVLAEHMSYLMTVPNIAGTLFGLYHTIHSRLETHKCLLKLAGRVDLVLAQIGKNKQGPESAPAVTVINEVDEDSKPADSDAEDMDDDGDAEMASGDEEDVDSDAEIPDVDGAAADADDSE